MKKTCYGQWDCLIWGPEFHSVVILSELTDNCVIGFGRFVKLCGDQWIWLKETNICRNTFSSRKQFNATQQPLSYWLAGCLEIRSYFVTCTQQVWPLHFLKQELAAAKPIIISSWLKRYFLSHCTLETVTCGFQTHNYIFLAKEVFLVYFSILENRRVSYDYSHNSQVHSPSILLLNCYC